MGAVNVNLLKARLVEQGLSVADLADVLDVNTSTVYRKLQNNGAGLLVSDAKAIVDCLGLGGQDAVNIFFSNSVA